MSYIWKTLIIVNLFLIIGVGCFGYRLVSKEVSALEMKFSNLSNEIGVLKQASKLKEPGNTESWTPYSYEELLLFLPSKWERQKMRYEKVSPSIFPKKYQDGESPVENRMVREFKLNPVSFVFWKLENVDADEKLIFNSFKAYAKGGEYEERSIDGRPAAQVLSRAGSESINEVVFFSHDKEVLYGLRLKVNRGASTALTNNAKDTFDRVLSFIQLAR